MIAKRGLPQTVRLSEWLGLVRRETGELSCRKETYAESLANYSDPESCVGDGNGAGEALTGASAGWVLSREIAVLGCRGIEATPKATPGTPSWQGVSGPREVRDPMHAEKQLVGNREIPLTYCGCTEPRGVQVQCAW